MIRRKNAPIFSVDGEIFYGYESASRVLATNGHYLFYKLHQNNGKAFEHNGRKVRCLNFPKIENWVRFERMKKDRTEQTWKKCEKCREYMREYNKRYTETHRELKNKISREYHRRKKLKEKQNANID